MCEVQTKLLPNTSWRSRYRVAVYLLRRDSAKHCEGQSWCKPAVSGRLTDLVRRTKSVRTLPLCSSIAAAAAAEKLAELQVDRATKDLDPSRCGDAGGPQVD